MSLACDDSLPGNNSGGRICLGNSVIEKVKYFFERDDNSEMPPGKINSVTIKKNRTKDVFQKRYFYRIA